MQLNERTKKRPKIKKIVKTSRGKNQTHNRNQIGVELKMQHGKAAILETNQICEEARTFVWPPSLGDHFQPLLIWPTQPSN